MKNSIKSQLENIFKNQIDPKFRQKIEKLLLRTDFNEAVEELKVKWGLSIKEYFRYKDLMTEEMVRCKKSESFEDCIKSSRVGELHVKSTQLMLDRQLWEDTTDLAKKFKLYPSDEWSNVVISFIFTAKNIEYIHPALFNDPFLSFKTKNCAVLRKKNDLTDETELFIKIYPDTSLDDVKRSWKVVMGHQEQMRRQFDKKRYYPYRTIDIANKLKILDTQKKSDWEKQEEIYGESVSKDWGKQEMKRKARIRQIRHRSKS